MIAARGEVPTSRRAPAAQPMGRCFASGCVRRLDTALESEQDIAAAIRRVARDGTGDVEVVAANAGALPVGIAVDSDLVVWANQDAGDILAVAKPL